MLCHTLSGRAIEDAAAATACNRVPTPDAHKSHPNIVDEAIAWPNHTTNDQEGAQTHGQFIGRRTQTGHCMLPVIWIYSIGLHAPERRTNKLNSISLQFVFCSTMYSFNQGDDDGDMDRWFVTPPPYHVNEWMPVHRRATVQAALAFGLSIYRSAKVTLNVWNGLSVAYSLSSSWSQSMWP